ncbi:helix-hairpin-helix domain-containing protein [bacterium]|nr:helix-hairpin-helix domain-containing protein [bacterium]
MGLDFTKNQKITLLAIAGIAAIGLSVSNFRGVSSRSDDVVITESGNSGSAKVVAEDSDSTYSNYNSNRKVIFQVAGCVKAPGVYSLPYGSRVYEAIKAAGGAKDNADTQSLNLAARIEDASKIVVPAVGQSSASPIGMQKTASAVVVKNSSYTSGSDKLSRPGEGVVHINSATGDELQRLPGVGPATAQKILDYRTQIGSFKSPEQLLDVKGIGPKKWEKMRSFVAL